MGLNLNKPKVPGTTPVLNTARPTCEAHFYRWAKSSVKVTELDANSGIDGTFANTSRERPVMVVNNDIIRATVQKDKASHAGSFTLVIKAGKQGRDSDLFSTKKDMDYLVSVNPGDWVIIYMGKTTGPVIDKTENIKMLGIVERVHLEEVDNPHTGVPSQTYVITGKDFGKIFETQLFFSPLMNSKTASSLLGAEFLSDSLNAIAGAKGIRSPDVIMKALISFFYGGTFAKENKEHELWYIPPSLAARFGVNILSKTKPSFIDILDYKSFIGLQGGEGRIKGSLPGEILIRNLPTSGSIWQLLTYYSNAALNELYCELEFTSRGIKPALTLRQLPYSVSSGNLKIPTTINATERTFLHALRTTALNSSTLKRKSLSKTEHERINHVVVIPKVATAYPTAYKATINPQSVQQYGLRSLIVETSYAATNSASFTKYCAQCVKLLTEWFFNADEYYNGTLSFEGLDTHVPIGSNILLEDIGQLFHVEGYTHNYEQNAGGNISYTTDFSVIRGCALDNNSLNRLETVKSTTVSKSILENIPQRVMDGKK